jgi:cytochrome c556
MVVRLKFKEKHMKLRVVLSAIGLVCIIGAAYAQSATIADRKAVFDGWGKATKPVGAALRGKGEFDLVATQTALKLYLEGVKKMPDLFPDVSKTGGKTEALPAIWDDKPKFLAGFTKFEADAVEALALIKDEASFKANMPKVLANCGTCHKAYVKPE